MRNRISALILSALLASSCLFASCGDTADDDLQTDLSDSGTTAQTEEVPELDKLENVDYEGYVFKVMFNDTENFAMDIETAGEETGDIMNDTVYQRNLAVEEKFNIKIESTGDVNDNLLQTVKESVMAGDEPYDFYFSDCHAAALAPEGYFYELNSLPGLDLSNPWWDKAGIEGMSVGNKLYLMTGDISPSSLLTSSCMVFNKNLHDDAGIEYPYDMVRNGEWTIIKLAEITADLTLDLNGDGEYKLGDDVYGYSSWMCDSPFSLFYGAGGMLTTKGSDDIPVVDFDMDKISSIYEYMYRIIITNNSYFVTDLSLYETFAQCFNDGGAYYCDITLAKIDRFLRDMDDDFGIIPIPKYDENQAEYLSCVNAAGGFQYVPSNASNPERTGRIVEALAAGAYDSVTPIIYEVITKTRNSRDEDSAEMVDLIVKNRVFDPYYVNLITGYGFMQDALVAKSESIVSRLESYRTSGAAAMEKIVEAYQMMDSAE